MNVNGDAHSTSGFWTSSDDTLKDNVIPLSNSLSLVRQIQPRQFTYKTGDFPFLNLPSGNHFGILAQEADTLLPELVKYEVFPEEIDSAGNVIIPSFTYKSLNYTGLIPITIQAIKELDSTVNTLLPPPLPDAPILASPADGDSIFDPIVSLVWNSSQGADSYLAEIAADSNFTMVVDKVPTTDTVIFFRPEEGTFYWRVNARNAGGTSPWSAVWSFTVLSEDQMDTLTEVAFRSASDSRYKDNVAGINDPLQKIMQLNGVSYDWKVNDFPDINFDHNRQIGFMAQDVDNVIPEVVFKDGKGFFSMDYGRLTPVLVEAMKEQQNTIQDQQLVIDSMKTTIDSLKNIPFSQQATIDSLSNMMAYVMDCLGNLPPGLGCEDSGNARTGSNDNEDSYKWDALAQTVELTNAQTIILRQNDPNPFAEQTVIRYEIPETVSKARIIFHDMRGVVIKEVNIETRGKEGRLQVYGSDLTTGVYTYSIICDGELVDTKRMVKR